VTTPRLRKLTVNRGGRVHVSVAELVEYFGPGELLRLPPGRLTSTRLMELSRASFLARDQAERRLYGRRTRDPALDGLLGALGSVPELLAQILPPSEAPPPYTQQIATGLARSAAEGVHIRLHRAFDDGLRQGPGPAGVSLATALEHEEAEYRRLLVRLRGAAGGSDASAVDAFGADAAATAHRSLARACQRAGRASLSNGPRAAELGLRASVLARRHAMLSAASVLLGWRLRQPRLRRPTAAAASRAKRLARVTLRVPGARRLITDGDVGRRLTLIGRATRVEWVERPRKPYSFAELEGTDGRLVVAHRSVVRRGLAAGCHVYALGNVKADDDGVVLEAEFEGPNQHRTAVWEDWLATLARPAYDLYPGSIAIEWELPAIGRRSGVPDLFSRLGGKIQSA
jgi:hypothetical protein